MKVYVKDGNINSALRKFKKKVEDSGVLMEVLARQEYEKPTTRRRRAAAAAKARWRKKQKEVTTQARND
jgi:small subunit ribosomal protein S21